jgi:hypothetical protein
MPIFKKLPALELEINPIPDGDQEQLPKRPSKPPLLRRMAMKKCSRTTILTTLAAYLLILDLNRIGARYLHFITWISTFRKAARMASGAARPANWIEAVVVRVQSQPRILRVIAENVSPFLFQ